MGELFTTFGINVSLLIVQIINFGLLLLALWYFLYRPVLTMLDERRTKISEGVENAHAAEARLHEIEGERDMLLKKASVEASEVLARSKDRAGEQATAIVGDANQRAETILTSAQVRGEEMKAQALRESEAAIGKAAILAAERILREKQT